MDLTVTLPLARYDELLRKECQYTELEIQNRVLQERNNDLFQAVSNQLKKMQQTPSITLTEGVKLEQKPVAVISTAAPAEEQQTRTRHGVRPRRQVTTFSQEEVENNQIEEVKDSVNEDPEDDDDVQPADQPVRTSVA